LYTYILPDPHVNEGSQPLVALQINRMKTAGTTPQPISSTVKISYRLQAYKAVANNCIY
jgi:hypothetical protein